MGVYKNCTKKWKERRLLGFYYSLKMSDHLEALLFIIRISHNYIKNSLKYEPSVYHLTPKAVILSLLLEIVRSLLT